MENSINNVKRLKKWQIKEIANNYQLTSHAKQRIKQRFKEDIDNDKLYWLIRHSKFAFQNNDGSFDIAIADKHSIIVVYSEKNKKYMVVTCLATSWRNYTTEDKYEIAKKYNKHRKGERKEL